MNRPTDQQLLREYAERLSEPAFAELVRRYVDLVYSAALRMVCDSHLAQDVTQGAFLALAKNAPQLTECRVLSVWLHHTARNLAANVVRSDVRRRAREQEAAAMNELLSTAPEPSWHSIAPHLDAALDELNDADREALLLRYFEKKSALEMAGILGISDEAAQKRVSRAVERLREFLSKRNATIGAGGLAVLISANAVQSAPVGLTATISAATFLTGTAVTTSTAIAVTKTIAMTTLQKTLVTATIAILAGAGIFEARQAAQLREQNEALRQQQTSLLEQNRQLQHEHDIAANNPAGLVVPKSQAQSAEKLAELLKLRGQVGALRQQLESQSQSNSRGKAIAALLNDPAQKELARIELLKALKSRYASFIQAQNLPPETVDKLFSLIAGNELGKKDRLAALVRGDLDTAGAIQDRDNAKKATLQEIQALLGDDAYARFVEFDHRFEAGTMVTALNGQMGGNPFTGEQTKRLEDLLSAEPEVSVDETDLFRSKESLEALYQERFDRSLYLLQQAGSFLNADQLATLTTINSNHWNDVRTKLILNQQLVNSTLGRGN